MADLQNQNFELHAGEDRGLVFLVTDSGDAEGTVVDVGGLTANWYLAREPLGEPILTKTVSPIPAASPPDGLVTIELDAADTELLMHAAYFYQCWLLDSESPANETMIARGWINLLPKVA
jgi:hypothetical protein